MHSEGDVHGKEGGMCGKEGMHGKSGVCVVEGACMVKGGMHGKRGEVCVVCTPLLLQDTAGQCAGGTHPTGMHSCFQI